MRADRLLSILLLLQNNGRMTAGQLAERLEVSERTILRDMEALGASGVPVLSERGTAGGWRLMEGYRTNLTGLTEDELQALLLASAIRVPADHAMRRSLESALAKLTAAVPSMHRMEARMVRERLYIDGAGWHSTPEESPWLATAQEAVWASQKLRIRYRKRDDSSDEGTWRTVEPLGLVAKGNIWYLCAAVDGEMRNYRISRIAEAEPTGESFDRPAGFDLGKHWNDSTVSFYENLPRYRTTLRLPPELIPALRKLRYVRLADDVAVDSAEPAGKPPGKIEIAVIFDSPHIACETLFAFGPAVEALEPPELRRMMAEKAERLLETYKTGSR